MGRFKKELEESEAGPLTPVGRETQWQVVANRRTEMSDEDFFFEVSIQVCVLQGGLCVTTKSPAKSTLLSNAFV